jgi:peptidoglycan biosynthesis protein MviN/MurJ (putative lipid II flippase)
MIKATAGVWVNYATTVGFQILFAIRFGSGTRADVFVLISALLTAVGTIITATVQSLVTPRLVSPAGGIERQALRLLAALTALAIVVFACIALAAGPLGELIADRLEVGDSAVVDPLRVAALFLFLQVLAGELIAVNLALGRRFLPAAAPAFPSTAGCVLLVATSPSTVALYGALAIGAGVEVLALAGASRVRRPVVSAAVAPIRGLAVLTVLQLALLTTFLPLERVMAAETGPSAAAQYNYALRSLAIVLQLLVGGVVLASLGDWSARRHELGERLRAAIVRTASAAALVLTAAAAVAAIAAASLVGIVYEHGAFSARDTEAVSELLVIALPGFVAEGVTLVLSQVLLAYHRNKHAIAIGFLNFGVRAPLIVILGFEWGARGVAAAYSTSMVVIVVVQLAVLARIGRPTSGELASVWRVAVVCAGTLAAAAMLREWAPDVAELARLVMVAAVFAALFSVLRPPLPDRLVRWGS